MTPPHTHSFFPFQMADFEVESQSFVLVYFGCHGDCEEVRAVVSEVSDV